MAARHVGRRIGTVSSQHRAAERRRRSTPAAPHRVQRGKRETLTPGERRHLIQLVACGSIFVLLVAVKLLLPGRMAQVNAKLTGMLEQNIDVQAVFSAVGRAVSGEADVDVALQDMYQAVFDPQEDSAVEVSAPAGGEQQLRQVHHRCPRGGLLHPVCPLQPDYRLLRRLCEGGGRDRRGGGDRRGHRASSALRAP